MNVSRKEPTLTAKLAAALRELFQIPHEHAKLMTDEQVLSLFQWHHIEYHATGGSAEHWNLDPLTIRGHRARTAKIDVPQIAKTRRISRENEAFRARMLMPRADREPKKSKWASRPFPKRKKSK